MGMYNTFQTDAKLEESGVWLDYGDFRILIAAAGQGNKKYVNYAEKKLKPIRRALDAGAVNNERSTAIMEDIYVKTIILNWQVKDAKDEWVNGIEAENAKKPLPVSPENVGNALHKLPRLFMDIQEQAASIATFRQDQEEIDSGNS